MSRFNEIFLEDVNIIDILFPVGSIIENSDGSFDPNTLYKGTTWNKIEGKFLVGVDDTDTTFKTAKSTGGEKTHKLTVNEMPQHNHGYATPVMYSGERDTSKPSAFGATNTYTNGVDRNTTNQGSGVAHNNLPPYYVVYMWERVS